MINVKLPGGTSVQRDSVLDVQALFNSESFSAMVQTKLQACIDNCREYPIMDKDRTVTIKLKLKPDVDKKAVERGDYEYKRAIFAASVTGPNLPETSVEFVCGITNGGQPFFNVDTPKEPMQITFSDAD